MKTLLIFLTFILISKNRYIQRDGEVIFPSIQANLFYTVHLDEQPSPSSILPSSHYRLCTLPSPQIYIHTNEKGSREYPSLQRQELLIGIDWNFKAELQFKHVIILPNKCGTMHPVIFTHKLRKSWYRCTCSHSMHLEIFRSFLFTYLQNGINVHPPKTGTPPYLQVVHVESEMQVRQSIRQG